MDEIVKKDKQ